MTTAYADIDDLLALFETPPTKAPRLARLESLLEVATDELIEAIGYDFNRSPTAGTRTWYVDTDGSNVVHIHEGLLSLSTLAISLDQGETFETIETTEYRTTSGWLDNQDRSSEPYFHLQLLPYGTWRTFPRGAGLVRLTGVTGRPAIPSPAREGVVERARQLAFADASYQGSVASDDQFGQPSMTYRWPDVTYKFIQAEQQRFMACSI